MPRLDIADDIVIEIRPADQPGDRLLPLAAPVLIDPDGCGWFPHAHVPGAYVSRDIAIGIGLAWAPVPELDKVLLVLHGGNPRNPSDDAIAAVLTRDGLRGMIADLSSIAAQLDRML